MQFLCESILENGVLSPLLVRRIGAAEEYEVISGHRRLYAAHKLGLTELPTVTTDLDRNAAAIALVDSNLHREHILPSEKAFAYKLKMEALSHQGAACGQAGHKSRDAVPIPTAAGTVRNQRLYPVLLASGSAEKAVSEPTAYVIGHSADFVRRKAKSARGHEKLCRTLAGGSSARTERSRNRRLCDQGL